MLPHDKYVMLKHIIKYLFIALFIMFFSTIIIPPLYFALNYDLLAKASIYQFVREIIPYSIMKNNLYSTPVLIIQTVKGRVVFFRKEREKISTLKPLTVWIFAVAISPPKTGNRIFTILPRFRSLHSNGKTVCATSEAGVRFCGGSAPAPPTAPKKQNGMLRNRA